MTADCKPGRHEPAVEGIRLTAEWVAGAVRGTVRPAGATCEFSGVSIDTRTLAPGDLFIAIRGDRFDGADFAAAAVEAGAAGVVVERSRARTLALAPAVVIEVDDTVGALQALGQTIRRLSGSRVVAITGSAGKTTTKEIASELLAARYRVVRNRGNLNNHIGLPLSLIELRTRPDVAVVELGMNHAGEISTLVRIAEPDVRVWTNVGEAHIGYFDSIEAIADAKAEILEGATRNTVLVANADDDLIVRRLGGFRGRLLTFGIDREADVRAIAVRSRGVAGTEAQINTPRGTLDVTLPLIGRGNLANFLAATGVALEFDVPLASISERSRLLAPASRRGEVLRLPGGVTIIDDSYNANPSATRRALDLLGEPTDRARRVAVLGEMLELGAAAARLHEDVGRAAAGARVDLLIAVGGGAAKVLADAAIAAGMPAAHVRYAASSEEAADTAAALVQRGDLVLVKGSRGVRADRVVDRLKAEFA